MDITLPSPPVPRHRISRNDGVGALVLACALALGGCAAGGGGTVGERDADGRPTEAMLQQVANSALPSGVANVHFVDGVVYVTGNVKTAIDANAVVRALRRVEGVDRVESLLRRGM